ncbi:MAG: methyltransferase domain-containing protein [Firmicutes bacterium]|jgi:SAM-dependent methyltransferase|nr:methyltransferase domain-containing protein [Bacillota bacterium]MCL5066423.1 methyltransferase domain-containing protein [Bacillota bacterium]
MAFAETLDQLLMEVANEGGADRWLMLQTAYTGAARRQALYRLPAGNQSRVADVGCGLGAAALEIAEHFGAEVHGFDQDLARLTIAERLRRSFPSLAGRVAFFPADVARQIPRVPFDIVTARFVLQYLPPEETLVHWRDWLKPGGCLYLEEVDDGWTVEYPPAPLAWRRVLAAYQAYAFDHGSDRQIGRKLPQYLERSGYRLTRVLWNPQSSLGTEQRSDPQVGFERERLSSMHSALVAEGYLTLDEFQEGIDHFDAAYPKMTFVTGATIQIWATP